MSTEYGDIIVAHDDVVHPGQIWSHSGRVGVATWVIMVTLLYREPSLRPGGNAFLGDVRVRAYVLAQPYESDDFVPYDAEFFTYLHDMHDGTWEMISDA